jgi:hypothetical protein
MNREWDILSYYATLIEAFAEAEEEAVEVEDYDTAAVCRDAVIQFIKHYEQEREIIESNTVTGSNVTTNTQN